MSSPTTVIYETDHARFVAVRERLRRDSSSKFAFLLDKNGQQIASSGDLDGTDATALASLTAGNVAATEGLAQLIGYAKVLRGDPAAWAADYQALLTVSKDDVVRVAKTWLRPERLTLVLVPPGKAGGEEQGGGS